jgi:hypothetical protein
MKLHFPRRLTRRIDPAGAVGDRDPGSDLAFEIAGATNELRHPDLQTLEIGT